MVKVKFIQIKNVVIMEVLEQSDKDTEALEQTFVGSIVKGDNVKLDSCMHPEISRGNLVYLRGSDSSQNNNLATYAFDDKNEAELFIERASIAITEFNKKINKDKIEEEKEDFKITIVQ